MLAVSLALRTSLFLIVLGRPIPIPVGLSGALPFAEGAREELDDSFDVNLPGWFLGDAEGVRDGEVFADVFEVTLLGTNGRDAERCGRIVGTPLTPIPFISPAPSATLILRDLFNTFPSANCGRSSPKVTAV